MHPIELHEAEGRNPSQNRAGLRPESHKSLQFLEVLIYRANAAHFVTAYYEFNKLFREKY